MYISSKYYQNWSGFNGVTAEVQGVKHSVKHWYRQIFSCICTLSTSYNDKKPSHHCITHQQVSM